MHYSNAFMNITLRLATVYNYFIPLRQQSNRGAVDDPTYYYHTRPRPKAIVDRVTTAPRTIESTVGSIRHKIVVYLMP